MRRPILLCFAILAGACSTATEDEAPESTVAEHTAGDFVRYNSPYTWVASDYAQFTEAYQSISYWGVGATPIADADPLTARLQAWTDRLDAKVRSSFEKENGTTLVAPKPIVKVLPTTSFFNAWVSPVPACTGAALGPIAPNQDPTKPSPANVAMMSGDSVWAATSTRCLHPQGWDKDGFVSFWNASGAACRIETDAAGALRVGGNGCQSAGAKGDDLGSFATSPFIHVTSDLLASVDEKTAVVVLAHELGHYYRGHVTPAVRHKYGFWFDRDPHQAKTPVPAANAKELEKTYREITQGPKPIGGTAIASHYSARLRPYLLQALAPLLAERTEPDFTCAKARDALGPWTSELLAADGVPSEEARSKFVAFESALVACASKTALTGEPGAASLSIGSVIMPALTYGPRGASLHLGDGLGTWLDAMNAKAKKLDDKAAQLVRHLEMNRIGLYTWEQEADDIAMELSVAVGLTPAEVLAGWIDFMGAIDKLYDKVFTSPEEQKRYRQENAELTAVECKALLDSEFLQTDASGAKKPVIMKLGNLAEPHHASCYRLYNLWRETRVHRFATGPAQDELSPAWSELKAEAAKLSGQ